VTFCGFFVILQAFNQCSQSGLIMTGNSSEKLHYAVDRFWHNYLFILEKNSAPKKLRQWYHKLIEEYIAPI